MLERSKIKLDKARSRRSESSQEKLLGSAALEARGINIQRLEPQENKKHLIPNKIKSLKYSLQLDSEEMGHN